MSVVSTAARPTLTSEQRRAVEAVSSVALRSGAGCGKTTVLTSKFLDALERGVPLSKLVAVTFTKKAAREIRGRVRRECRRRLLEPGSDRDHWRRVLRGLEASRINTFHSLCLDYLRRFPERSGLPPEFQVLEETVAPTLRDEALRASIRAWLADSNPDFLKLAQAFGLRKIRESLSGGLIASTIAPEAETWTSVTPENLIEHWKQAWRSEIVPQRRGEFLRKAEPLRAFLQARACRHPKGAERRAALLADLEELPRLADPIATLERVRDNARVQGGGKAEDWPSTEDYEQVKEFYKSLREDVDKLIPALKCQYDQELTERAAEDALAFARLVAQADRRLIDRKRAAEVADYNDLLRLALNLVREGEPAFIGTLQREIALMLVDEFQDTDPTQARLVESLLGGFAENGRLFLVGDTKQSIYRFRGARPDLFGAFEERMTEDGRQALTENFRSSPALLAFYNHLFGSLYDDSSDALQPGRAWPDWPDEPPPIELVWASDDTRSGGPADSHARRKTEARWLARLLAGRFERGWRIRDPETGTPRQARPSDVTILLRAMTYVSSYEDALVQEGLDAYTIDGRAYYAQREVLDLVNLLAAIEDPFDEPALAATLRGPFFAVSDEGLYALAATRRDGAPRALAERLEDTTLIETLRPSDRRRLRLARERLGRWRSLKDKRPIAELLEAIFEESDLEAALVAEPRGDRKRGNVRKLARIARRYDRAGYRLADFAHRLRIDHRELTHEDEAATSTERGDAVRLRTIHSAKGLEFPIVVVADLDRSEHNEEHLFRVQDRYGPVAFPDPDPEHPPPKKSLGNLGAALHKESERLETQAEAHRLFYVAATRATSHLIFSSGLEAPIERSKPSGFASRWLIDHLDPLTGAIRQPHEATSIIPRVHVITQEPERAPSATGPTRRRFDRLDVLRALRQARFGPEPLTDDFASETDERGGDARRDAVAHPLRSRVHELMKRVWADPTADWLGDLDRALARNARRAVPALPRMVVGEARVRLEAWRTSEAARRVASASRRRSRLPFVSVEGQGGAVGVAREEIDLAFRENAGWIVVHFRAPEESFEVAETRLQQALSAAPTAELEPIAEGWLLDLDGAPSPESWRVVHRPDTAGPPIDDPLPQRIDTR